MAAKTKTMSTVKQILRLFHQGKKIKFIARNCCVSKNTIKRYLQLQSSFGHSIEELLSLEDAVLETIFSSNITALELDRIMVSQKRPFTKLKSVVHKLKSKIP